MSFRLFRSAGAISALLCVVLLSCVAVPPVAEPPAPPPESAPPAELPLRVDLDAVRVLHEGIRGVRIEFDVAVDDPAGGSFRLAALVYELRIGDRVVASMAEDAASLDAAGTANDGPNAAGYRARRCFSVDLSGTDPQVGGDAGGTGVATGVAEFMLVAHADRATRDGGMLRTTATAEGAFPVVRAPSFSILSIKIKRAELINTKLEVLLRVDNPNAVPLDLAELVYELFGGGRLWTDGVLTEAIPVPAAAAVERKLLLSMNFINMKRGLLDQVIDLAVIDYRFRGTARILTPVDGLPDFVMPYDLRGRTPVVE